MHPRIGHDNALRVDVSASGGYHHPRDDNSLEILHAPPLQLCQELLLSRLRDRIVGAKQMWIIKDELRWLVHSKM